MPSPGPILPEDVLFQDSDVCILKPNVKKGILIFTDYTQPKDGKSLCESGLKTGAQLKQEGIEFGGSVFHDYIFFRAPYFPNEIDYESIESEIESSFGEGMSEVRSRVWIRVDPQKTYVYSSEIRAKYDPYESGGFEDKFASSYPPLSIEVMIKNSRKTMTEYLRIIRENEKTLAGLKPDQRPFYNLYSSKVQLFPSKYMLSYPWDDSPIHMNSEVLVRIPHLTPNYFVKCTPVTATL
jgi:hypothetical protein